MKNDTEFTCEVVEVVEILPIEKADKVEVVRFKFADGTVPEYQCVVGKEEFMVGGLAIYISDDSMVPVARPEFEFLKKRLDYKGATHYRVRAAKIRGVVSTGMMVRLADISGNRDTVMLGTDMSAKLGVIKYVRPEEQDVPLVTTGTTGRPGNRLFRRLKIWLTSSGVTRNIPDYSVLSLRKVPQLFSEGETVVVTEKIHGTNIRFGKVGGRLLVGSHHTIKTDHRGWLLRTLFPRKSNSWYGEDIYSAWANRSFGSSEAMSQLPEGIIFYGELFGGKIQDLNYGRTEHTVAVFDAYDIKAKRWLERVELLMELPGSLNMPPVLCEGPFNMDLVKRVAECPSVVSTVPQIMEGVVVRSVDYSKAGKWVSNQYLTRK